MPYSQQNWDLPLMESVSIYIYIYTCSFQLFVVIEIDSNNTHLQEEASLKFNNNIYEKWNKIPVTIVASRVYKH